MITTIFLRIQNALEIDFRQSNTTSTLYGNWAAEAQLHGGLPEQMSVENREDTI